MSPRQRRLLALLWAAIFVTGFYFLLPLGAIELNEQREWPRFDLGAVRSLGATVLAAGVAVAVYCSRLFQVRGQGTPSPIDPPTVLVESGLYRYSRNPIYVADVAIFLGWFVYSGELALLAYTLLVAVFLQVLIARVEEPQLLRRFGEPYADYVRRVPRWIGLQSFRAS